MFKFKYSIEPSQEDSNKIIDLIYFGLLLVVLGALIWLGKTDTDHTDEEDDDYDDGFDPQKDSKIKHEFIKRLPKDKLERCFDSLRKLSDDKIKKMLSVKANITPAQVESEIKLNKMIRSDWVKIDFIRQKLLHLNPKDVADESDSFMKIIRQIPTDSYLPESGDKYSGALKEHEYLIKKIVNKQETSTLADLGWNKSNIHLVKDHIVQFFYDGLSFRDNINTKNEQFYANTTKFITKMFPYVDWFGGDNPHDPRDISEELKHIENDEGVVVYAFGQTEGMVIERPFDHFVTTPLLNVTGVAEKILKKLTNK